MGSGTRGVARGRFPKGTGTPLGEKMAGGTYRTEK